MKRIGFWVLMSALAMVSPVAAEPLRLEALVAEALRVNPDLQAARARWEAAKERPVQMRSLDDPEVGLMIDMVRYGRFLKEPDERGLEFTQRFPFPGKLSLRGEASEAEARAAGEAYQAKAREVAAKVKEAYWELYFAHLSIDLHFKLLDLLHQAERITQVRYATGKGMQSDVLKAQTEITRLHHVHLLELEQMQRSARAMLNALLNRPPESPLDTPRPPSVQPLPHSLEALQAMAKDRRPEVRAAGEEIARRENERALAEKQYYPDFTLGLSPWRTWTEMGTEGAMERRGYGVRFMMSLPFAFWTKPKYDAGVREAEAMLREAHRMREAMRVETAAMVADLYAKHERARGQAERLERAVIPQAQLTVEATRRSYEVGRVDFLSYLESQKMYVDQEVEHARALMEYGKARAQLERVAGVEF